MSSLAFDEICADARKLLSCCKSGVLSTISVEVAGYPFGSVVPYCLDGNGNPFIYISDIAQHTKNIESDTRVSLILQVEASKDVQAEARLTLLADADKMGPEEPDLEKRYFRYFPSSSGYGQAHGFFFYRLRVFRARYIGGFGEVYWLEKDDFLLSNPFTPEEEERAVAHMNAGHTDFLENCLRKIDIVSAENGHNPVMAGMDAEGFDVRLGAAHYRFSFPQPVRDLKEARERFKSMASEQQQQPLSR